jgi:4-hydroxybenzoate polyprenyltransferase
LIRLGHPFPSLLDGIVVAAVAVVAAGAVTAGSVGMAVGLGLSMTSLQIAIGTLNDLVDASADAGVKPAKPIPTGLVTRRVAVAVGGAAAVSGIVLVGVASSAPATLPMIALAVIVLAIGAWYDLAAKGTPWSWAPFAAGIPILPVYGWIGAVGSMPPWLITLVPMAVLAGAGLAIANGRADIERDEAAGVGSVAIRLGSERAWWVHLLLLGGAALLAFGAVLGAGASIGGLLSVLAGVAVVGVGAMVGRVGDPARRERAWQLEAIGVAGVAIAWLLAVGAQR